MLSEFAPVMATFPMPDRAMAAALKMREALKDLKGDLLLKIGIHEGPCLAVSLNDRQDYFGRTVNIAARVQGLATSRSIFATRRVVSDSKASKLLQSNGIAATPEKRSLRGIANQFEIFEIPWESSLRDFQQDQLVCFVFQSATITRKKVAGIEVASLLGLLFWLANNSSNSRCRSAARPFFSAASNAFMVGP